MSSMMFKNGVSKVFHNREIMEAKKAGWTFSPDTVVKPKSKAVPKYKMEVFEVEVKQPKITTDLSGPEDLIIGE